MTSLSLDETELNDPFYFLKSEKAPELQFETFTGKDWRLVPNAKIDEDYANQAEENGFIAEAAKERDDMLRKSAEVGESFQSLEAVRSLIPGLSNVPMQLGDSKKLEHFETTRGYRLPSGIYPELKRARESKYFDSFYIVNRSSSYLVIAKLDDECSFENDALMHPERLFLLSQFGVGFTWLRSQLVTLEVQYLYKKELEASRRIAEQDAVARKRASDEKAIRRSRYHGPVIVLLLCLFTSVYVVGNIMAGLHAPNFLPLTIIFGFIATFIACGCTISPWDDKTSRKAVIKKVYGLGGHSVDEILQVGFFVKNGEVVRIDDRLLPKKK